MYRITKLSGKYYACKFDSVAEECNEIQDLLDSGDIVTLTDDIEYFCDTFDIDKDEVEIV